MRFLQSRRSSRSLALVAAVTMLLVSFEVRGAEAQNAIQPQAAGALELQQSFDLYQAGRYQEALAAARAAIAANPKSADAYNNLAVAYMGLRQIDEAIQAAEDAIRLRPDYQLAKNNLAWFRSEKAVARPVTPAEAEQATDFLNQSVQHYEAKRFEQCLVTALRSTRLNPTLAPAFNNAGICAGNLQLWDEAIRNTQEAIRLDPNSELAKNNLAWIQQEREKATGKDPR